MIQGNNYGKMKWELVQDPIEIPSTAPVSSITIPNLNGDMDDVYLLVINLVMSSQTTLYGRFNGDAGSNYSVAFMTLVSNSSGFTQGWNDSYNSFITVTGYDMYAEAKIDASKGKYRQVMFDAVLHSSTANSERVIGNGAWRNTTSTINSITLLTSNGSSTFYGTIELYKKVI